MWAAASPKTAGSAAGPPRSARGRLADARRAPRGPGSAVARTHRRRRHSGWSTKRGLPALTPSARRSARLRGDEHLSLFPEQAASARRDGGACARRHPGASVGLDPIDRLRFLGWEYRAMAHRHPRLFHLVALHRLNMPAGVAFIERMLRHFHAAAARRPAGRAGVPHLRLLRDRRRARRNVGLCGGPVGGGARHRRNSSTANARTSRAAAPFFKRSAFRLDLRSRVRDHAEGHRRAPRERWRRRPPPKPVVRPKA